MNDKPYDYGSEGHRKCDTPNACHFTVGTDKRAPFCMSCWTPDWSFVPKTKESKDE